MKIFKNLLAIFIAFYFNCMIDIHAWNGYDKESNSSIEIRDSKYIKEGDVIEIFDWQNQQSHLVRVLAIENAFNSLEIKVQNEQTQENRTLNMETN